MHRKNLRKKFLPSKKREKRRRRRRRKAKQLLKIKPPSFSSNKQIERTPSINVQWCPLSSVDSRRSLPQYSWQMIVKLIRLNYIMLMLSFGTFCNLLNIFAIKGLFSFYSNHFDHCLMLAVDQECDICIETSKTGTIRFAAMKESWEKDSRK